MFESLGAFVLVARARSGRIPTEFGSSYIVDAAVSTDGSKPEVVSGMIVGGGAAKRVARARKNGEPYAVIAVVPNDDESIDGSYTTRSAKRSWAEKFADKWADSIIEAWDTERAKFRVDDDEDDDRPF